MRHLRSFTAAAGLVALLVACSDEPTRPGSGEPPTHPPSAGQLDAAFAAAEREFAVPASLLKAIGYVETRWQMVRGEEEFPGRAAAWGIMALRGEALDRGASLARVDADAARTRPEANVRAAAALLSAYAGEMGINRADLRAWAPVVARYSGIRNAEMQDGYVRRGVYAVLKEGVPASAASGSLSLDPWPGTPELSRPSLSAAATGPDYPPAIWRPSPEDHQHDRPSGDIGKIHMLVIHTCEGGYWGCVDWLTSPDNPYKTSAHYVVKEDGAEISQLVYEARAAHHTSNPYDCSLNSSHECWRNGYINNEFTIGIEHGGYASQSSFPVAQIDESAKLACDITRDRSVPRDRYHIVGHAQLAPTIRTDPGPNWPWSDYMNRINSYCNTAIIVDSNNNNNDTARGYIEVSSNWIGTNATPGYYGTGYYYASTQAISDGASFWFYLPAAATKTIDAWWTSGTNRSTTAPFVAFNASGTKLGTVWVDQQVNGGKWNQLGSWSFSAGWNRVVLSRWTTEGYVVIADAVRVR